MSGEAERDLVRRRDVRLDEAMPGNARRVDVLQGDERPGCSRPGMARPGKARNNNSM